MATANKTGPKIKAIAPWFGGKRTLAPVIVEELGQHSAYWEPFCGSMAVLLAKPESSHEHVNDLHGDLVNLARVIQHPTAGPKLYRRLRRAMMYEDILQDAHAYLDQPFEPADQPDTERAYHYFLASWIGRNGVAGTHRCKQTFAVRWTPHGGAGGARLQSAVASIPVWRRRMRRVTILQRDAFDVIASIADVPGVAIYVDPPYLVKSGKYAHDFDPGEHEKLAELLNFFLNARVVVSYYDHPRLADLYPARFWIKRDVSLTKNIVSQSMRDRKGKTVAPEVLLLNGPSYAQAARPRLFKKGASHDKNPMD